MRPAAKGKKEMKKIAVVGGGIAGLTATYNLLKKNDGFSVLLLEKDQRLGGLAKSFVYQDRFTFDIGPKRFHTEDDDVIGFIREIAQHSSLMNIGRNSKVLFLDNYYSWPLSMKDMFKLPLGVALASTRDLLLKNGVSPGDLYKFESYIVSKYGKTLYEIFFKPYTEKFLRLPVDDIHADWASTGINRSIINKENKGNSFLELVHQILLPAKVESNFLYPEAGGFGGFWDKCAALIARDSGAAIRTGITVTRILKEGATLLLELSDGSRASCDHLFWSGRLPDLLNCIDPEHSGERRLPFINTTFLDIVFQGENIVNRPALCHWLYVSSPKTGISRISFPRQFNPGNMPDGHEGLCVEITCRETEGVVDEEALIESVLADLRGMKVISGDCRPHCVNVHTENSTYPVYHSDYKRETEIAFAKLGGFSDRITPFGRCGSFWYNNADHSIRQALALTDALAQGKHPAFNFRRYFGGVSGE